MSTRLCYIAGLFVIIGVITFALCFILKRDTEERLNPELVRALAEGSEEASRIVHGPMISGFLGLDFPGQYAFPGRGDNPRDESYLLTEEDRHLAITKLQDTFRETNEVSVTFHILSYAGKGHYTEKHFLQYNKELADKLCRQSILLGETCISTLTYIRSDPDITFTFHPSELNISFRWIEYEWWSYASFGKVEAQRWGSLDALSTTLLDSRLQNGATVRSTMERISSRP